MAILLVGVGSMACLTFGVVHLTLRRARRQGRAAVARLREAQEGGMPRGVLFEELAREVFDCYDYDASDSIDADEIKKLVRAMHPRQLQTAADVLAVANEAYAITGISKARISMHTPTHTTPPPTPLPCRPKPHTHQTQTLSLSRHSNDPTHRRACRPTSSSRTCASSTPSSTRATPRRRRCAPPSSPPWAAAASASCLSRRRRRRRMTTAASRRACLRRRPPTAARAPSQARPFRMRSLSRAAQPPSPTKPAWRMPCRVRRTRQLGPWPRNHPRRQLSHRRRPRPRRRLPAPPVGCSPLSRSRAIPARASPTLSTRPRFLREAAADVGRGRGRRSRGLDRRSRGLRRRHRPRKNGSTRCASRHELRENN